MATRAQKAKVGLFLVICLILMAGGLMLVSGYKHEEQIPYRIEFEESVLGLSTGGTVEYLGVPVGTVEDIFVKEGHAIVEILVSSSKKHPVTLRDGVRAKLVLYSLATGVLVVSLSGGAPDAPILPANSEIPVTPSLVAAVSSRVEGVLENIGDIAEMINSGLEGMEEGGLTRIVDKADTLLADAREFLDELTEMFADVKEDAQAGMEEFRKLTEDLRELAKNADDTLHVAREKIAQLKVGDTEEKLGEVLDNMAMLTEHLNELVTTTDAVMHSALHEVDNVEYVLRETLRTATDALESIRTLAESIEEDPAQVLRGKGRPTGGY